MDDEGRAVANAYSEIAMARRAIIEELAKAFAEAVTEMLKSEPKESLSQELIAPGDVAIGNPE